MPFGVVNGSATFQRYILILCYASIWIDYALLIWMIFFIYSVDPADHINDVRAILKRLLKYELFVKLKKCVFHMKEISFLGFLLTTERVKMEPNQVSIIVEWPEPTTFREI